nr:hypothetical protein B0A51_00124 [Rachicladosporium sp. CCFEE 5018]
MDFDDYGDDYGGGYEYDAPLTPGGRPYFGSNPTSREWDYEAPRGQGGPGSFGSNYRVGSALSPPIADRAYHRELWMDDRLGEEDGLYECIQEDEMTAGLSRGPALRDENPHLYAHMPQDRVDLNDWYDEMRPLPAGYAGYEDGGPPRGDMGGMSDNPWRRRQSSALAGYDLFNYDALEGYDYGSMPGTMDPYMDMGPGNPYQDMARSRREAYEDETLGGRIYDRWDPPSGLYNDYRGRAGRGNLGTNVMGGPPVGPIRDDYDEPELFAPQARRAMPPYREEDLEEEPYGPYDPRYEASEDDEAPPLFRTGGFAGDPFRRPPTPPTDVWAAAPQLNPRRRPDRSIITSGIRGQSPPRFGRGNSPVPTRRWGSVMNSPSAHSLMSVGRADAYPHYAEPPPGFWDEPEEEEPMPMLISGLGGGLRALAPRPSIGGGGVGAFGDYDVGEFDGWTAFHGR